MVKRKFLWGALVALALLLDHEEVPRRKSQTSAPRVPRRNFIREWRNFRGYTLEQLSGICGLSVSNISNLEKRKNGYTADSLERLADALECHPGDLLNTRPGVDDELRLLWKKLSDADRQRWLRSMKAFAGD